jgi:hypothetical protein
MCAAGIAGWVNRGRFSGQGGAAVEEAASAALDLAATFLAKHLLAD